MQIYGFRGDFKESPRTAIRLHADCLDAAWGEQRMAEINRRQMNTVQLCGMSIVEPGDAESCIAQGDPDRAALVHDCMRS